MIRKARDPSDPTAPAIEIPPIEAPPVYTPAVQPPASHLDPRSQLMLAQAQAQMAATAKTWAEVLRVKPAATTTVSPLSGVARLKREITEAGDLLKVAGELAGPNPWEPVMNSKPVEILSGVLGNIASEWMKGRKEERVTKAAIKLEELKVRRTELALKAMELAQKNPEMAKAAAAAAATMPTPPSAEPKKKPAPPDEHEHDQDDEDEEPSRIHPDDLKKIEEHDARMKSLDAKIDQLLAKFSPSTAAGSSSEATPSAPRPKPSKKAKPSPTPAKPAKKAKTGKISAPEMERRVLQVVELVAGALPSIGEKGGPDLVNQIRDGMEKHRDKVPGLYSKVVAQLRKPPKDDGIGQIESIIRDVSTDISEYSKAEAAFAIGWAKSELDSPETRAKLPSVLAECLKVLEA